MKKNRRIPMILLALCLCAAIAVAALAEGAVGTLYRSATGLLFDTDNATITAHAEFSYNGLPFKTLDGRYLQDGVNSLMKIDLKTPRYDGRVQETGFTVVGNGDTVYSIDPVDNPFIYNTSYNAESRSILSSSALRRALVRLGGVVADATESSFADAITVSEENGGTRYQIKTQEGRTPALVNAAGTLLAQVAANRFFYIDYDQTSAPATAIEPEMLVQYEDYYETLENMYQREYGEPFPENFYELLWKEDSPDHQQANDRYDHIQGLMETELVTPTRDAHSTGAAVIRADGRVDYYATVDEYYVDNGLQMVEFADFDGAFRAYYEKTTGTPLDQKTLNAIYSSDNEALQEAYYAMYQAMVQKYQDLVQADGKASMIYIFSDGSYRMIYDYNAYLRAAMYSDYTVTDRILRSMESLELGDSDFSVTLDAQNRITGANGQVTLVVTDNGGFRNKLEITFDVTVDQYGETTVKDFDPKDYGVMSWAEFHKMETPPATAAPAEEAPLPENLVFDGVQYQVQLREDTEQQ